jgi:ABC-type sugar transport system permease subunit
MAMAPGMAGLNSPRRALPRFLVRRCGAGRERSQRSAYLFLAPSLLILLVFVAWPIAQSLWMSLHDWSLVNPHHRWVGLTNYKNLLHDGRFTNALRNTIVYSAACVSLQIAIGLGLALALDRKIRGITWLRAAYFFPVISSLATMAIVWKFMLDRDIGLVDSWLGKVGLPSENWLQSTTWALPAVILVGVWKNVGFSMVILLAGLQGIPEERYEAAATDGAGPWRRFRDVTLPGLRPSLLFATVIAVIASLQVFDQVYVMTGGGPLFKTETLVTYMYHQGFNEFNLGYAAAIAWVLFLMIIVVSIVQLRLFRYDDVD